MKGVTILETVVGSTLHGTAVQDGLEDLDLMAVVVEDMREAVAFDGIPDHSVRDTVVWRTKPEGVRSEAGDTDYVAYGLRKYLTLALKGNPTLLLALFAPEPRVLTNRGHLLQELAPKIVSRLAYHPFRGYMRQQRERLEGKRGQMNVTRPELIQKFGYDTKYASHIVRLGIQGCELLGMGYIMLPLAEVDRKTVIDVRTGRYGFKEVIELIEHWENALEGAFVRSPLPPVPDYEAVHEFMLDTYGAHWVRP